MSIPILVDTMDNEFEKNFAAWPFRFYGIRDGNVLGFKAQPESISGPYAYDVTSIEKWLDSVL